MGMYATIWAIVGLPPLGVSSRYRGVGRTFERPRHTAGDFKWGAGLGDQRKRVRWGAERRCPEIRT